MEKVLIPKIKDKVVQIYVGAIKSVQLNRSRTILNLVTHDLRNFELYLFAEASDSTKGYGAETKSAINLLADHVFWCLQEDNFYYRDNTGLRNHAEEKDESKVPEEEDDDEEVEVVDQKENDLSTSALLQGDDIYKEKFSLTTEFQRQFKDSQDDSKQWKKSDLNKPIKNRLCDTYPDVLYFPSNVSDETINEAAKFRKKNRIPTLTYWSSKSGGVICRSSQPKAGIGGFRKSQEDIELIKKVVETTRGVNEEKKKEILIIDCRSRLIANTNSVAGGGTEQVDWYKDEKTLNASIHYCKISNIHAMRKSLRELSRKIIDHNHHNIEEDEMEATAEEEGLDGDNSDDNGSIGSKIDSTTSDTTTNPLHNNDDDVAKQNSDKVDEKSKKKIKRKRQSVYVGHWTKKMEESSWFKHVKLTVRAGLIGYDKLKNGFAILVHCSDGWDRTAQVSSLIQIFAEPYYRTITGFCTLVAKDFCAFGHKFRDRGGYGQNIQEASPIFIVSHIYITFYFFEKI